MSIVVRCLESGAIWSHVESRFGAMVAKLILIFGRELHKWFISV
jgi:predicted membrane protein